MIRIGVITPHTTPGPEVEFASMAGSRVTTRIARVTGCVEATHDDPTAPPALRELTRPRYLDRAAETLQGPPMDVVAYASTTSAYAVGAVAERAAVSRLADLTGLPVGSTGSASLHALEVLGVERVALVGAPWFSAEFNELGAAYYAGQGFDVVSSESAHLPRDPDLIEAAAVVDWVTRQVGDAAEAVVFGGNGFRTASAIAQLEAAIDRPVLTANQVLLWEILSLARSGLDIDGYGRLFARRP